MEPTLAGPIEFSPAEIAAIIAVLAGLFVVLTAPGWGLVAYAAYRRRAARGPGRTWPAALGGALGGLAVCAAVAAILGGLARSVGSNGLFIVVPATWLACAVVAWLLLPRGRSGGSVQGQGWGR